MIIRRLEGQEVLDALHLVWEVFAQDVAPLYTAEGVASFQDFIRYPNIEKKMQAEGLALFGAFEGPQMLGAGGILPTGHIALLFVRREYQHRGIGKALLMEMCSFAVQVYGVQKFTVNASPGAVDAYRHMGMHDTAPEQNAGGMRFIPMEMWAASVPIRKKRGKGMYIAGAVGALCLVLTFVVGAAITRELDYAAENGVDGYLEDGGQWGEDGSSIEDWYDEFYGDYGQDDSEPQEESGIDAIPEYVDEDCGYEVTEDNYTYTADNTSSTTIQFEVYYPQVDGLDESPGYCGNQVFPLAPDGVDLVGRVLVHPHQFPQGFSGGGVADRHAHQLRIEALAGGQGGILPADQQVVTLEGQGGVHILHPGKLQQKQVLVDMAGGGYHRSAVQIKGLDAA